MCASSAASGPSTVASRRTPRRVLRSPRTSRSRRSRWSRWSRRSRRSLRGCDDGVSEVVGQLLMFGILSMVLILSLLGFNAAKSGAENRVAALEAESMIQRVAGVYVSASLFAEEHVDESVHYERVVDLPDTIQERSYTLTVQSGSLVLDVPGLGIQVTNSLLSADAAPDLVVCEQGAGESVAGGRVRVVAEPYDGQTCTGRTAEAIILYLEPA